MSMNRLLQTLLARPDVWQASRPRAVTATGDTLPSGHAALDRVLHRGGWPRAALTEVLSGSCGIGEMQLLAPALAHCSRGTRRLFFVCPPYLPYAPALLAQDVALERLLVVRAERDVDTLWCAEQILRSGAAACLLAWLPESRLGDYRALRRLQLAAQGSASLAFLFRPPQAAHSLSPAALRIVLRGTREHLALEIVKQRGGQAGQQLTLARANALLQPRIDPALLPATVDQAPVGPALSGQMPCPDKSGPTAERMPCPDKSGPTTTPAGTALH